MERKTNKHASGDILCFAQLEVTEVGEKLAVVSLRYAKTRGAMAMVCKALELLCLKVITASVTTLAGSIVHTMFVEVNIICCISPPTNLVPSVVYHT
jgi:hypothetical protein